MEIITNKKYKVNKIQKNLSLGFSKYGAEIDKGDLLILAAFHDTSHSNVKIKISNIREISYRKIKNNEKDYYGYEIKYFYQKYRKPKTALCMSRQLSASSWKELLNDLAQINPEIMVSDEVDVFLQEDIQESNPWKINFEQYNHIQNFNRDAFVHQRFTYVETIELLLLVILSLFLMIYPVICSFLIEIPEGEYKDHKIILFVLGNLFTLGAIIAFFKKLISFKKTKYLPIILFFILGMILIALSLSKNWIG